jgi:hypothetical protein
MCSAGLVATQMPDSKEGLPIGRHLIIAALLFCLEVVLGVGLIGGAGIVIAPVVLFSRFQNKPQFLMRLEAAAIYGCLVIATVAWLRFNWPLAERRAVPVIAACRQYQAEHGRYPKQLTELVPALLPSIPDAKYTLVGRKFGYDGNRPGLYFAAMFHGIVYYDFQTDSWRTND